MNCTILTPLALEFEAVKKYLPTWNEVKNFPYYCIKSSFKGQYTTFQITLVQTGSNTNPTTLATEKSIQAFQPDLILLTGVAGGVKDAGIGDLVVATQAYGYESGKETTDGFVVRPNVKPFSPVLIQQAQSVTRKLVNKPYQVFFGPIASGDKVIASTNSPVYRRLKQHYNDTLALEMEAIGFAEAITPYRTIHALNVRGISDLLDDKPSADAAGTQEAAAANAAEFVINLLYHLDPDILKMPLMNVREIAKKVVNLLFPLLKLNPLLDVGKELIIIPDDSISAMWNQVSSIFLEEFQAEVLTGEDITTNAVQTDLKHSIRIALRRCLAQNEEMAKGLHLLWERYQAAVPGPSVVVTEGVR